MGSPTGFLDYKREVAEDAPSRERVKNYEEFHRYLPLDQLKNQAARCLDCGTPYCQMGFSLNGMNTGCPIHNLMPEWNHLVYANRMRAALERLQLTNNFPEFTGRVCPAPCEGACTVAINKEAVTIKTLECQIIDYAFEKGWIVAEPPQERTGKKVAVVGSGPAGLAAAMQLNRAGHSVTVYERDDQLGGLLMYGIPNMKLDKSIVKRRIGLMSEEGIQFVTNTHVGKDLALKKLTEEFDAVVLACGATEPRDLSVPGRDLKGIHFAMEYLKAATTTLLSAGPGTESPITAKDKRVIVIGGGDTGTDCVATAIRQGCKSVRQLELMPCPPRERTSANPWPEWPRVLKTDYGQEEAIELFGDDPREYNQMTHEFIANGDHDVKAVRVQTVTWEFDPDSGRHIPISLPQTEKVLGADLVLIAMGFMGPEESILRSLKLKIDTRHEGIDKHLTHLPNVFIAGDMRRGQSLVVWAIHEGRTVAKAVDEMLMGQTELPD